MPVDLDKLRRAANCYKVQKWLVHYFVNKVGRENMHKVIDPSILLDMTTQIPPIHTKIEIIPNARDLKLQEDLIVIEWNLFVLGTKRMFIGRTSHQDIMSTLFALKNGNTVNHIHGIEYGVTPKKMIAFITRILRIHEDGYIPWVTPQRSIDQILNFGILSVGHNHGGDIVR